MPAINKSEDLFVLRKTWWRWKTQRASWSNLYLTLWIVSPNKRRKNLPHLYPGVWAATLPRADDHWQQRNATESFPYLWWCSVNIRHRSTTLWLHLHVRTYNARRTLKNTTFTTSKTTRTKYEIKVQGNQKCWVGVLLERRRVPSSVVYWRPGIFVFLRDVVAFLNQLLHFFGVSLIGSFMQWILLHPVWPTMCTKRTAKCFVFCLFFFVFSFESNISWTWAKIIACFPKPLECRLLLLDTLSRKKGLDHLHLSGCCVPTVCSGVNNFGVVGLNSPKRIWRISFNLKKKRHKEHNHYPSDLKRFFFFFFFKHLSKMFAAEWVYLWFVWKAWPKQWVFDCDITFFYGHHFGKSLIGNAPGVTVIYKIDHKTG